MYTILHILCIKWNHTHTCVCECLLEFSLYLKFTTDIHTFMHKKLNMKSHTHPHINKTYNCCAWEVSSNFMSTTALTVVIVFVQSSFFFLFFFYFSSVNFYVCVVVVAIVFYLLEMFSVFFIYIFFFARVSFDLMCIWMYVCRLHANFEF